MLKQITTEDFKKEVFDYVNNKEWKFQGELPIIIDFYADWCGPCKQIAPVLEELATEYEGKINVLKLNVDENQEVAGAFGIRNIPSVLFVPMEGQPQMSVGALPKEGFVQGIKQVLFGETPENVPTESSDESSDESQTESQPETPQPESQG